MKFFVLISVFVAVVYGGPSCGTHMTSEIQAVLNTCYAELNIDQSQLTELYNNGDKKTLYCFNACIFREFKQTDSNGKIIEEAVHIKAQEQMEMFGKEYTPELKAIVSECIKEANKYDDECEIAGVFTECQQEKLINHIKQL